MVLWGRYGTDDQGQIEPFHHTDRNALSKIAELAPYPMARK
jgi:predicted DNA-binding WGR domain protein